jgi:DNA-binding NarL/FixJ family response regulator
MSERARVLIVDDHPLVREGLNTRISAQSDMEVCGEADDVEQAMALSEQTAPALILVDLSLKNGNGLTLIKKVSQRTPQTRILVISAHPESLFAERALRAGAHGYINKQEAQGKVIEAIRTVLGGQRYLSTEMTQRLVSQAVGHQFVREGIEALSDRELEIFELIGKGRSTRTIAQQLNLSVHTIETHRENIRAKLNLRSGSELVQRAVQWVLEAR